MTEFVNRPYLDIVAAATIPALLYFTVIFATVHLEAKKLGLATIPKALLPSPWALLRRDGYLLAPLAIIIGALIAGRSIANVAVLVTGATFLIAVLRPRGRLTARRLLATFEETARATVGLSVAAAAAGIVLGAIFAVGLSFQVAQAAAGAAGDQLWLLLILAAVMALIMGMGMTAIAIYLTLVATVIPILIAAGVPPMAAHFFAFWYGIISNITPPVALTAFAAAPIARASPIAVGAEASRLGVACFILPILFVYDPALLLEGPPAEILRAAVFTGLGLIAFAAATTGWAFGPMPLWQRAAALGVAALGAAPDLTLNLVGLGAAALTFGPNLAAHRSAPAPRAEAPGPETERLVAEVLDETPPTVPGEARGAWHWAAWAMIAAAWAGTEAMGAIHLQARQPLVWTGAMAALSLALSAGVVLACNRSAVRAPAPPG